MTTMIAHRISLSTGIALLAVLFCGGALGLDSGLPPGLIESPSLATLEVTVERLDRRIEQDIAFTGDRFRADQEENRIVGRAYFPAGKRWHAHLDAGFTDSDEATNLAPLFGGGLGYRIGSWQGVHASAFATAYYIDAIEYRRPGQVTRLIEFAAVDRTESYLEYGGGLQFAAPWHGPRSITLVPYAGVLLSEFEVDGDENYQFSSTGKELHVGSVDFDAVGNTSVLLGAALVARENFGLRFEWRTIDQSSYSAGLFFSF